MRQGPLSIDSEPEEFSLNKEFVLKGILCSKSKDIREYFKNSFDATVQKTTIIFESLFIILSEELSNIENYGQDTREFFQMLTAITSAGIMNIGLLNEEMAAENKGDAILVFSRAIELLKRHESKEKKMLLDTD